MKRLFLVIVIFVALFTQNHFCQENNANQLIVYGDALIKVPTNIASYSFTIYGLGSTLETAVNKSRDKVKKITSALIGLGLKEQNFSTSSFHSGENRGDKAFLSSSRDFRAAITVNIKVDSLDMLEQSIIKVSEFAPDNITNVKFTLSDYSNYSSLAFEQAGIDAMNKALNLAKKMNLNLGSPIYIEDISEPYRNYPPELRGSRGDAVAYYVDGIILPQNKDHAFFSPLVEIKSQVKVIYSLK